MNIEITTATLVISCLCFLAGAILGAVLVILIMSLDGVKK